MVLGLCSFKTAVRGTMIENVARRKPAIPLRKAGMRDSGFIAEEPLALFGKDVYVLNP